MEIGINIQNQVNYEEQSDMPLFLKLTKRVIDI
jgi:hypothetical protein